MAPDLELLAQRQQVRPGRKRRPGLDGAGPAGQVDVLARVAAVAGGALVAQLGGVRQLGDVGPAGLGRQVQGALDRALAESELEIDTATLQGAMVDTTGPSLRILPSVAPPAALGETMSRDEVTTTINRVPPRVAWRVIQKMVQGSLGRYRWSRRTVWSAVLAGSVGLPLVGTVAEKLLESVVALVASEQQVASALMAILAMGVAGTLVLATAVFGRADLGRELDARLRKRGEPAQAQRALVLSCSEQTFGQETLDKLCQMSHEDVLQGFAKDQIQPRQIELLLRSFEFHGARVERIVLLVDRSRWSNNAQALLKSLTESWIASVPGRRLGPVEVHLAPYDNANDAEAVRALVVAELRKLGMHGIEPLETAVGVTLGTAAMSIGMTLAAALCEAEVQCFPQLGHRPYPSNHPAVGKLAGVEGLLPVRVDTEPARIDFEELAQRQH
ncbi:hypothetical protein [Zoogloea sp.]|uniref:hypothetical protein n=1 Tax=Zoogloea sp. TaxID=49181 RepID=UPI0025FEC0AC|nr:hypothetical protein [Zoogloea sp.]MCK6396618.1 hypothetical protein [Zoogloea sp.]